MLHIRIILKDPSKTISILLELFKGSLDPIHCFETIVGKSRIRPRTTLNFLNVIECDVIKIQSRSVSDPTLVSKIKWLGSELPLKKLFFGKHF